MDEREKLMDLWHKAASEAVDYAWGKKAEMFADYKSFKAVEEAEHGGFEGYGAVFNNRDLGGDVMLPGSVRNVDELVRSGFIGLNHDWDRLPIAIITDAKQDDHGLWLQTAYHSTDEAQAARRVALERLNAGKSVGLSIGYTVLPNGSAQREQGTRELRAVQVHEVSQVNAPMNPQALMEGAKAFDDKTAHPVHTTPKADEGAAWDGPAEVGKAEGEEQLWRMHAWRATDADPDVKSSYKLPHHRADGTLVWRGTAAAMGAIMGSRGGVDIPDSEKRGVYNHIAAHYRQFDKEPPEFRGHRPIQELAKASEGAVFDLSAYVSRLAGYSAERAKEGRVLSGANRQRLTTLLDALNDVRGDIEKLLRETEPEKRADARRLMAEFMLLSADIQGVLSSG